MNTKEILNEINKTREQLNKLKGQLKQAEEQEKFNTEFYTPILDEYNYKTCLKFLQYKNVWRLSSAFPWGSTPQGKSYWLAINTGKTPLRESDIQQIKDWVINYLIQKSNLLYNTLLFSTL